MVAGKEMELFSELLKMFSQRGSEQHHQEYKKQPNDYTNVAGQMIAPNELRPHFQNQNFQFNQSQNAMNNFNAQPNALAMPNYMMPQQNQQALQNVRQQLMLPQAYPFPSGSQSLLQSNISQQHLIRPPMQPHMVPQVPPFPLFSPRFNYDHQQFLSDANAAAATIAALCNPQQHQQIAAATAMLAPAAISGQINPPHESCQVCNDKVICLLFVENFKTNY